MKKMIWILGIMMVLLVASVSAAGTVDEFNTDYEA